MRVTILRAFAGWVDGRPVRFEDGTTIELPPGVDWLDKGLVAPAPADGTRETANAPHAAARETAVAPETRKAKK